MEPQSPFSIPSAAWTKLFPIVDFTALTDTSVKIRFEGETLSFLKNFNAYKIPGRYEDAEGKGLLNAELENAEVKKKAFYVRIIKEIDVSSVGASEFVLRALAEKIYQGTLVIVKWKGKYEANAAVTNLKSKVLEVKNVRVLDTA